MVNQVWVDDKTQELLELKAQRTHIRRVWENDRHSYTDKLDDQLADTMMSLKALGYSNNELCEIYGSQDKNTIRTYLHRRTDGAHQSTTPNPATVLELKEKRQKAVEKWRKDLQNRTAVVDDEIAIIMQAMRDEGLSQRKIAKLYGTQDTPTIRRYLEREC